MKHTSHITVSLLRLLLMLAFMFATDLWLHNPLVGAFVYLSGLVVVVGLMEPKAPSGEFEGVESYHLYSQMRLFSTVAVELSVVLMIGRILDTSINQVSLLGRYGLLAGWLLLVSLVAWLFKRYLRGRWRGLSLAEFVVGAIVWVIGEVGMFSASTPMLTVVWTVLWALGILMVSAALEGFMDDLEAIGFVDERSLSVHDLHTSNTHQTRRITLVSAGVIMLMLVVWMWLRPTVEQAGSVGLFRMLMLNVPLLCMLVAIVYAARYPLDHRNREKLMNYLGSHTPDGNVKHSLQRMLGHHAPLGTRIICWLAMPFFRHKVVGREHLRAGDYPSVFVCNHGFLYGPIVAALYLPTYFRPWIHDRMLNPDKATMELAASFPWLRKLLGRKAAMSVYKFFGRLVCKLLLTFRPISVVRGSSHDSLTTFTESLKALQEGDNLLLFPEKPKRLANEPLADLRNFYTGFAHLGKVYHDATGRSLLFYPIYSDHHTRRFIIGEPVQYNPEQPPREAKRAVAERLQERMEKMIGA